MLDDELKHAVMRDIVLLLSQVGVKVVLVHGGGPEITDMLKRVGKESEFVGGLRVTDARNRRHSCRWCCPARSTRAWFPIWDRDRRARRGPVRHGWRT